jgi:hypothetical protein
MWRFHCSVLPVSKSQRVIISDIDIAARSQRQTARSPLTTYTITKPLNPRTQRRNITLPYNTLRINRRNRTPTPCPLRPQPTRLRGNTRRSPCIAHARRLEVISPKRRLPGVCLSEVRWILRGTTLVVLVHELDRLAVAPVTLAAHALGSVDDIVRRAVGSTYLRIQRLGLALIAKYSEDYESYDD